MWAAIEDGIDRLGRDPDGARQAFARALRLDPGNGLAMKYLADVSFRAGRDQEARDGYRRALAAGFRHPDAFVNLAAIAERHGRLDEARDALREAVTIGHADADAWNRLGLLEARRGAADEARRAFASAIAAEPGRAEPCTTSRSSSAAPATKRRRPSRGGAGPQSSYPEAQCELGTGYLLAHQPEPALKAYRAALDASRLCRGPLRRGTRRRSIWGGRTKRGATTNASSRWRRPVPAADRGGTQALRRLNAQHP